jgi:allophanate hydrolase
MVELDDGATVHGFLCESAGLAGALDISKFGGWRAYLASLAPASSSAASQPDGVS